jgi:hypothetical protein
VSSVKNVSDAARIEIDHALIVCPALPVHSIRQIPQKVIEPTGSPEIPDPFTKTVEFQIEISSIGDRPTVVDSPCPIPEPEPPPLASTFELKIKTAPIDDLPGRVPIPGPKDEPAAITVERQRVTFSIDDVPP